MVVVVVVARGVEKERRVSVERVEDAIGAEVEESEEDEEDEDEGGDRTKTTS